MGNVCAGSPTMVTSWLAWRGNAVMLAPRLGPLAWSLCDSRITATRGGGGVAVLHA